MSRPIKTDGIAFKVRLPKRTGRKRKRGSNDPYVEDASPAIEQPPAAKDVVKRLRDNADSYRIEAVGRVNETHRFRTTVDLVSSASGVPLLEMLNSSILDFDFAKMKQFELAPAKGAPPNICIAPPKIFSIQPQPYNYFYRQNPAVRIKHDSATGQSTLYNASKSDRLHLQPLSITATLPSAPPSSLPPLSSLSAGVRAGVAKLRALLAERPIITRRVGLNDLGRAYEHNFKSLSQYCGFQFRSGPWRDTLVRYGVDPRAEPEYGAYQTVMFHLAPSAAGGSGRGGGEVNGGGDGGGGGGGSVAVQQGEKSGVGVVGGAGAGGIDVSDGKWRWNRTPKFRPKEGEKASHIFDGRSVWTDGKVWQLCDIEEPLLREMLDTCPLREECDLESDGWFPNGTMAKLRVIMKDMINVLLNEELRNVPSAEKTKRGPSEEDRAIWKELATLLPEIVEDESLHRTYISPKRTQPRLEDLSTHVRSLSKRGMGGKYGEGAYEMGVFDKRQNAARLEAINWWMDEDRDFPMPIQTRSLTAKAGYVTIDDNTEEGNEDVDLEEASESAPVDALTDQNEIED
ncbi:MAG: tau 95 subunit of transcription factor TFIIIC [Bathelium mastoideum]|nr:MAG: tau 95 subunit of transcription factor TFIIIC [Bathelium mastoideum]